MRFEPRMLTSVRSVSAYQRKRVNIAWDRCADPQFLILDEPTSGLDATTSLSLTQQLLKFCYPTCADTTSDAELEKVRGHSEKLVLMVIHQPRVEIFRAADQVLFMDRGRVVYSGSPRHVTEYFKSDPWLADAALKFPVLNSKDAAEADFCMDYVNSFNAYERDGYPQFAGSLHMAERWIDACASNPDFAAYNVGPALPEHFADWPTSLPIAGTPRPSGYAQFRALILRHIKKFSHAFDTMCFDLALIIFSAFASGIINGSGWQPLEFPGIALMSVVGLGALGSVVNVRLYGNDRLQTRRELQSGMDPWWYWLSVFLMDLGRLIAYPFIWYAIFYNFIVPASHAVPMFVVYWCVYWACGGFGQFMSLLTSLQTAYLAAALLPLVIGGFLNGVSPSLKALKDSPLLYVFGSISYARWACERLCSMEFMRLPDYQEATREALFDQWGFNRDDGDECIAWLITMGVIMRLASIFVLVASTSHIKQRTISAGQQALAHCGRPLPTSSLPVERPPRLEAIAPEQVKASMLNDNAAGLSPTPPPPEEKTQSGAASTTIQLNTLTTSDSESDITIGQMRLNQERQGERTTGGGISPFSIFIIVLALACVAILVYLFTY